MARGHEHATHVPGAFRRLVLAPWTGPDDGRPINVDRSLLFLFITLVVETPTNHETIWIFSTVLFTQGRSTVVLTPDQP